MMATPHLGGRPHPVVAAAARELLNKAENERSGVLSTALSFLTLYRDPVVAAATSASDWRIADLVHGAKSLSLYLVVPPSDLTRTRPLVRLVLNQILRRLTESWEDIPNRHRLLLMLDEFPALGCVREPDGVPGRLRHPRLPDRPEPQPDREGLWSEQRYPRQLPCAHRLCHQ